MSDGGETTRGPWRFVWRGGRLADVYHAESDSALDCTQVGAYDWRKGESTATLADLETAADEWVAESAPDFARELPYLP